VFTRGVVNKTVIQCVYVAVVCELGDSEVCAPKLASDLLFLEKCDKELDFNVQST
jgi:hypothetical protein